MPRLESLPEVPSRRPECCQYVTQIGAATSLAAKQGLMPALLYSTFLRSSNSQPAALGAAPSVPLLASLCAGKGRRKYKAVGL